MRLLVRRTGYLRMRYHMDFRAGRPGPNWSPFVAEQVRLPTWSFEARERGELVFVRTVDEGAVTARLFLRPGTPAHAPSAALEVAVHGRWEDSDADKPPLAGNQQLVAEAEALLVLLGVHLPKARFLEAYVTRK